MISVQQWRADLLSLAAGLQTDQSQVLGAFSSVFGPHNTAVLVWRHKHIDTAHQISAQLHTSQAGKDGGGDDGDGGGVVSGGGGDL